MPKTKIVQKHKNDKFYTKEYVVDICLDVVYPHIEFDNDIIIEPSAGNGAFYNKIHNNKKIGLDIEPEHPDILCSDWFTYIPPSNDCVIVGNPPFGTRNILSKKFIEHGLKYAKIIAFILPKVYRKETMQKVFTDDWSLIEDIDIPENSFLLNGDSYHVPCIFQVWINKNLYNTQKENLRESEKDTIHVTDFIFGNKKTGNYFIFGAAPHKIIPSENVLANNRGYYIICDEKVKTKLEKINWKDHSLSSVNGGASWFTKKQILTIYGDIYNNAKK